MKFDLSVALWKWKFKNGGKTPKTTTKTSAGVRWNNDYPPRAGWRSRDQQLPGCWETSCITSKTTLFQIRIALPQGPYSHIGNQIWKCQAREKDDKASMGREKSLSYWSTFDEHSYYYSYQHSRIFK